MQMMLQRGHILSREREGARLVGGAHHRLLFPVLHHGMRMVLADLLCSHLLESGSSYAPPWERAFLWLVSPSLVWPQEISGSLLGYFEDSSPYFPWDRLAIFISVWFPLAPQCCFPSSSPSFVPKAVLVGCVPSSSSVNPALPLLPALLVSLQPCCLFTFLHFWPQLRAVSYKRGCHKPLFEIWVIQTHFYMLKVPSFLGDLSS